MTLILEGTMTAAAILPLRLTSEMKQVHGTELMLSYCVTNCSILENINT